MQRVVKVRFRNSGRGYYFDALDFDLCDGTSVIVNTTHGDMLGTVSGEPAEMDEARLSSPLKPVLRIATEDDLSQMRYFQSKESEALAICRTKVEARGLAMKLVNAEYAFNGSKLTFYFTADSRVDFRELLKDLTAVFKARIDLRQIGDRDEAKKCGGLGFCGRPVCCNTFLTEFTPVSIKMAKTQNLSLNPLKISGICGKLMCCLRYEQEAYESMQKVMPGVGKQFITPDGPGTVLENNAITETTKLKITLQDGTFDVRSYPFRDLMPAGGVCEGCGGCGDCEGREGCEACGENESRTAPHDAEKAAEPAGAEAETPEQSEGEDGENSANGERSDTSEGGESGEAGERVEKPQKIRRRYAESGPRAAGGEGAAQTKKPYTRRFDQQHPRRQARSGGEEGQNGQERAERAEKAERTERPQGRQLNGGAKKHGGPGKPYRRYNGANRRRPGAQRQSGEPGGGSGE